MGRVWRRAGKWGRATRLENGRVAPNSLSAGLTPEIFVTHATPVVSSTNVNDNIIDLYSIEQSETTTNTTAEETPFTHNIRILGPNGEALTVRALFDGGAMVSAMGTKAFNKVQHSLGNTTQSKRRLRMADGTIVPSQRKWEGPIELGNARVTGGFEVFDGKGGWDFLFGKPLLRQFKAVHDYGADTVTVKHPHTGLEIVLHNQSHPSTVNTMNEKGIRLTLDVEQRENTIGGTSGEKPPSRQVPSTIDIDIQPMYDKNIENVDRQPSIPNEAIETKQPTEVELGEETNKQSDNSGGEEQPPSREVIIDLDSDRKICNANNVPGYGLDNLIQVNHIDNTGAGSNVYTRHTDPFKPERVARIISEVTIGPDTTPDERREVENLIAEFADCFALAMSEVNTVPGAVHKLNIPPETKFRTRIGQRSLNPAQKEYLHTKVDEMVEAGVIAPIHPRDVRAVAPVVFSKKTHEGQGLLLDELKHRVNDQCITLGLPSAENLPPRPAEQRSSNSEQSTGQSGAYVKTSPK
jgi:hypothetical protein